MGTWTKLGSRDWKKLRNLNIPVKSVDESYINIVSRNSRSCLESQNLGGLGAEASGVQGHSGLYKLLSKVKQVAWLAKALIVNTDASKTGSTVTEQTSLRHACEELSGPC